MKVKKFKIAAMGMYMKRCFIIVFCLVTGVINAQFLPGELPVKQGIWDYPVKPGMEEWKQFNSNEAKVNACQIPEEALSSLSTEDLTDLCLRYPLLWDFYAFNSTNDGLDKLFRDFNGIRELYKREDVSIYLTRRYLEKIQSLSFLDDTNSSLEKGLFVIYVSVLEGLLSRIELQNRNKENLKEVLQTLVTGYEGKLNYVEYFMGFGLQTNFYSRAHVIAKMEPSFVEQLPHREKNAALYSGMVADEQTVSVIDELSYQLIK